MKDMNTAHGGTSGGTAAFRPGGNRLMEANQKLFERIQANGHKRTMEQTAKMYGIKDWAKVFDWAGNPDFSVKAFREGAYKVAHRKSMEAQAELAFGQLLRAGVQNTFNDIYQDVEVVYPALVRETSSNKRQEFYAPLERNGFPKRVPIAGPFPESNFVGLDIEMINVKTGMMFAIERELVDDDMTGQILQRAQQMGENARIYEEVYVMARMFNSAFTFDGETMTTSNTYATPFATGVPGVSGGIHGNGNGVNQVSNGRLSQAKIQDAYILAKKMLDQSGRPMVVDPKVLAVSPQDIFYAKILLESASSPSMSSTASADLGKVGGSMAVNPIQQLVGVVASRFIPDYMAQLIDTGKGFNFQRRDPTEMVQENPQSGPAFSQEVFRYKERARWEADFIDPKFHILINQNQSAS